MKPRNMIVIIILMGPVSVAALALMALATAWLRSEIRKKHGKESVQMDDNASNEIDQVEEQTVYQVSKEEDEVASNVVASGRGEESEDIFEQVLRVVAEAEAEHGALRREEAPQHVDIVGMIRALLVQCYGEQWRHANFAHYHTFSGNCLFVAMAVASHSDTEATLHCRVVEVDPEGHFIFPNPVKVEESEG